MTMIGESETKVKRSGSTKKTFLLREIPANVHKKMIEFQLALSVKKGYHVNLSDAYIEFIREKI